MAESDPKSAVAYLAAALAAGGTAALLPALTRLKETGCNRQALYDALHQLYLERREASLSSAEEEEEAEDLLDRLWGHCPRQRLLFPELPGLQGPG